MPKDVDVRAIVVEFLVNNHDVTATDLTDETCLLDDTGLDSLDASELLLHVEEQLEEKGISTFNCISSSYDVHEVFGFNDIRNSEFATSLGTLVSNIQRRYAI